MNIKSDIGAPTVSVIVPVYNTEKYLEQCLKSIVDQTLLDIEIICIDDGSQDRSLDILLSFSDVDHRIAVIQQKNLGPGLARNRGIDEAKGKYIIFLDSDDWFEKDFLEEMVKKAEETHSDVVICQADEFDTNTNRTFSGEWMLKKKYISNDVFTPSQISEHFFQFTYGMAWDKLYRAEFIRTNDFEFPALSNSEDLVFVFSSLLFAKIISICPRVFIHHRVNRKESVSNSRDKNPDAPYQAFKMIENVLICNNLLPQYEKSFRNWAMEFLVWHVSNMNNYKIQKQYFIKLKNIWFPRFAFENDSLFFYENKKTYFKYFLIRTFPYFIFWVILKIYKLIVKIIKNN